MKVSIVVVVLALTGGCAWNQMGETVVPEPEPPHIEPQLAEASTYLAGADAARIRLTLRRGVSDGGLWFEEPACRTRFGAARRIADDELDAFAGCLATLHLTASPRVRLPDIGVYETPDGVEIEAWFATGRDEPHLLWIAFVDAERARGWRPTLAPHVFEAARTGPRWPTAGAARAALDAAAAVAPARASTKICVDRGGAVTDVDVYDTSSASAGRAIAAAVRGWTLRPIVLGGHATPACALVNLTYPPAGAAPAGAAAAAQLIPLAPLDRAAEGVPLGKRVFGYPYLLPTYTAWRRIPHNTVAVGVLRFCTDETGRVARVEVYDPTGVALFDAELVRAVQSWRYEPTIADGKPVPACGQIAFENIKD